MCKSKLVICDSVLNDEKYMGFIKEIYSDGFDLLPSSIAPDVKFIYGKNPFVSKEIEISATYGVDRMSDIIFFERKLIDGKLNFPTKEQFNSGHRFLSFEVIKQMENEKEVVNAK